jgi:hypothetical protein
MMKYYRRYQGWGRHMERVIFTEMQIGEGGKDIEV